MTDQQVKARFSQKLPLLPNDFQETVISFEIKHKKEPNDLNFVKKLLYLYSVRIDLNKRLGQSTTIHKTRLKSPSTI